jgi:hypothetical protein
MQKTDATQVLLDITTHLTSCGAVMDEVQDDPEVSVVDLLVEVNKIQKKYPTKKLIAEVQRYAVVVSLPNRRVLTIARQIDVLYTRYPWAGHLVDDPDMLASVREAINTRPALQKCLWNMGQGKFNDDIKALLSTTTRILVECEKTGQDELYDVASFILAETAVQLLDRKTTSEFLHDVQVVFLGDKFISST